MEKILPLGVVVLAMTLPPQASAPSESPVTPKGLEIKLGEGVEPREARTEIPRPPAVPLSDGDVERLLSRLPAFDAEPPDIKDTKAFAFRDRSLPPPRTGRDVLGVFPPPEEGPGKNDKPSVASAEPLTILRYAPEGDVPLAPYLSVTFSQPMVPLASVGELTGRPENLPIRLTPEPPGRFRFVGTKTLFFEPQGGRFPMATDYVVVAPEGVRPLTGGRLAARKEWRFSTPPVTVQSFMPSGGPARRDTVLFAVFDQRIDPAAVLGSTRTRSAGASFPVRLATEEEIARDERVVDARKRAVEGRFVAFRAESLLPPDAAVEVVFDAGTPSAEGPKKTTNPQVFTFRTYGRLRVTGSRCGWDKKCRPRTPFEIEFTNPLDAKRFKKDLVRIEPELPGRTVSVYGSSLHVYGPTRGRTKYTVSLSPDLPDEFGQTLGSLESVSFQVGEAEPRLWASGGSMVVLDPAARARFSVYSINHETLRVRAYRVEPQDFTAFAAFLRESARYGKNSAPPGRLALDRVERVKLERDEMVETSIDLVAALPDGVGHLILTVEPEPAPRKPGEAVRVWVQATEIGLDAFTDDSELLAWTSSLRDGRPFAGVEVELLPSGARQASGMNGLATLPLGSTDGTLIVARRGKDVALLVHDAAWWDGRSPGWRREARKTELRYFVFDDRKMYRPGEEVKIKGWIRSVDPGKGGDVGLRSSGLQQNVVYWLTDSRGAEITRGLAPADAWGGFDFALKLPDPMNLGPAQLHLAVDGGAHTHSFQVQEFRRPEYEVDVSASGGPHFVGGSTTASVTASYFAGGGLSDAEALWRATSSPGRFVPPNLGDYVFGRFRPWWDEMWSQREDEPSREVTFPARTDASGKHYLRMDFVSVNPPEPMNVAVESTVTDVNRQAWTDSESLLVHPSSLYVGLKTDRYFIEAGQPLAVDVVVSDLDGRLVPMRTALLRLERMEWEQEEGEWKEKAVDPEDLSHTSSERPGRVTFQVKTGGMYRLTATVRDDEGRRNETQLTVWVAGGRVTPRRGVTQDQVRLIPDKKDYRAGDTASILVMAPFPDAEGLLTLRRSGLVRSERFTIEGSSHTLRVPIEDAHTPNLHVQVDLVGSRARSKDDGVADPKLPPAPAFAAGTLNLDVPPRQRTLRLDVTPAAKALEPGGETSIGTFVKDAQGKPVANAQVAVVVVDEAVLSLTGYRIPDPLNVFYAARDAGVADRHSRQHVQLGRPEELETRTAEMELRGVAGGAMAEGKVFRMLAPASAAPPAPPPSTPIRARIDFSALALFAPATMSDAEGRTSVTVKLPDNLTRYRIMAVAAFGNHHFGSGESTLTARLPLMVRPSPPRFLNFGDQFELPVVVQNQTESPLDVDVVVRSANLALTSGRGRRVRVPAADRVEVRFPAAADRPGKARFQVGAASGVWADASEVALPVWTPATTEAFATYGQIDRGAVVQPVRMPAGAVTEFGGVEVTTSSTALHALTDAVLYLVSYPFDCSEQIASRVLGIAALKDVLGAFGAEGLEGPDALRASVTRDLEDLARLQNDDGSFGFWRRGDRAWPYLGIHVAHAVARAKSKGFEPPAALLARSVDYLRDIERHIPSEYSETERQTLVAYALNVRSQIGAPDVERARRLAREKDLPFEAVGFLLPLLPKASPDSSELERYLLNRVTETAGAAHFAVSYGDRAYLLLHSDRRADAIVLDGLIQADPASDLIPKIVAGLLAQRKAGRWLNTQENAFVLLALDRYFNTYEKVAPDFVARLWLGDGFAGEHRFSGYNVDRYETRIPFSFVGDQKDLVLAKEGAGRLYYRVGVRYAPRDLKLEPLDVGFTVERTYEAVDDPKDVSRDPDGTWRVKSGARVRVRLTLAAPARRYHVALVDPLPAGLEPLNPALATTGSLPPDGGTDVTVIGAPGLGSPSLRGAWWWWTRPWFEHQNLRDERVEAFASLMWEGVYTYSYFARATTPGTFVVPPPKAEEMYSPETFGRGATTRLVVQPE